MGSNEVQSLSPLNNNVCPLELGDNTYELLNSEYVDTVEAIANDVSVYEMDMLIDFDVDINMEDMDISKAAVNANHVDHVDLMNDKNSMTTEVESQVGEGPLGDSNPTNNGVQYSNSVASGEPSVSCNKRKCIKKLLANTIVVSSEYTIEDVQIGNLFLSKTALTKKLYVFVIRKNFQYRVDRSTKKLYFKMRRINLQMEGKGH